jgi:hypothetical protein
MATVARNAITRLEGQSTSVIPDATAFIDATISWNQGDLLYLDTTAHLIKPITVETQAATFLGIAPSSISLGKPVSPYQGTAVDAAQGIVPVVGGLAGVVAKLYAKTSDAFNPGDLVYSTAVDSQTVSSAGTKAIGVYLGPAIGSAVAGQLIEVHLGHRFPGDTLVCN